MAAGGLGGVLFNSQHNFAWLTGGGSNGIDLSRENGASYLLVRHDGKRFLIANNIEMPRLLAEEVSENDFEPIELSWQAEKTSKKSISEIAASLLLDSSELGSDIYLDHQIHPIEPLISACRHQLTDAELIRYRQLGRDAGKALGDAINLISPGETEKEISRTVRDTLASYDIYSVVTLVGADDRLKEFRHPVPTENDWKNSLLIAVCARRHGLIASLSRIITAGVDPELERNTEAVATVNSRLFAATRPDASASDLYKIATEAYAELGFADEIDKHHQGGACGYRTRDWNAHSSSSETAKHHQAFAWNPSITGTKIEETGIVTESGFEVITATPGFPQISVVVDGREYISPGILSL